MKHCKIVKVNERDPNEAYEWSRNTCRDLDLAFLAEEYDVAESR